MNNKAILETKRDVTKIGITFLAIPSICLAVLLFAEASLAKSLEVYGASAKPITVATCIFVLCCLFLCLCCWLVAKQTAYRVDRKGVYVYTGLLIRRSVFKPWLEVETIQLHKDPLDLILGQGTGTIRIPYGGAGEALLLQDIRNCSDVYDILIRYQTEVIRDCLKTEDEDFDNE